MSTLFTQDLWAERERYVSPEADFAHHGFDPTRFEMGEVCLVTFSSGLFRRVKERIPVVDEDFPWPYETTPLHLCRTASGKPFGLHFPSYGSVRITNSLEQLAACGYRYILGLGLGGTLQEGVDIGDVVLLEGAVRGDGVSRYYAPEEFPAVADFALLHRVAQRLEAAGIPYHVGLSFGTDALYREVPSLIERLRELGVLLVDLESSAFLTVGRRLGLQCSWVGVVSDRLVESEHEGNIHMEHVADRLLRLSDLLIDLVDEL